MMIITLAVAVVVLVVQSVVTFYTVVQFEKFGTWQEHSSDVLKTEELQSKRDDVYLARAPTSMDLS